MNKSNIEILAPCSSFESVLAAVRNGANAVYIGAPKFSARANASKMEKEQLAKAIDYCHFHSVSVHIALNTLLCDRELKEALSIAGFCRAVGADAFIVQDMGLAALLKEHFPDITLHASTQMTVHTPEGAKLLYSLGFERVVLAREMNREEIKKVVCSGDYETEVFVHGALCMCVSGQCYLSSMIGGRSGNRGRCAQPCRLPFKVEGGTGYDLSLKDNCLAEYICELEKIGVTSAKIEGRLKRPEYTAAAVRAYRTAADKGKADVKQLDTLKSVFSRSGFTDGYYVSKTGKAMFGKRSKEDVVSATDKLLSEVRLGYKDEISDVPVTFELSVCRNKPSKLQASSRGFTVCAEGDVPQVALNTPLSEEKCREQLSKTGGTGFYAENIHVQIEQGLMLPISQINKLRRSSLEKLYSEITDSYKKKPVNVCDINHDIAAYKRKDDIRFRAMFQNTNISDAFKKCELVTVPLFSKDEEIKKLFDRGFDNLCVELPRVFFGLEDKVSKRLEEIKLLNINHVYVNNIGAVGLVRDKGFVVHGGFGLNIFNSETVRFYESLGLSDIEISIELEKNRINELGGAMKRGIVGYGYLPLMIMRNCPNKNGRGCGQCGGSSVIKDRTGRSFKLRCSNGCTELFNGEPLVLSEHKSAFKNIDFMTLRFTDESVKQTESVLEDYLRESNRIERYTKGLYFRGVE